MLTKWDSAINSDIIYLLESLRTTTNKVGFLLQLGYFRSHGKFYPAHQFRQQDIHFVLKLLRLDASDLDFEKYQKRIPALHRKKILTELEWTPLTQKALALLGEHILWQAKNQDSPKQVFFMAIDYCWRHKLEVPYYNQMALLITQAYNDNESILVNHLKKALTQDQRDLLTSLVSIEAKNKIKMQRPPITLLKKINQSLRPSDIQENIQAFLTIKEYFYQLQPVFLEINLSDQATEYFATWVQKAEAFQINSFTDKNKLFLHLLAYIKHQYYLRQDVLIDIFLKSVKSILNAAKKQLLIKEKEASAGKDKAIKQLTQSSKGTRILIEEITQVNAYPHS